MKQFSLDRLSVEDRSALMYEISESIAAERAGSHLNEAQRDELHRRLEDHKLNPDDSVPWEQVKAETLAELKSPCGRT